MDTLPNTEEPRLFLSYSRRNSAFIDELIISVESYGFDVQFDRADLFPGEPWEPRLRGLISEADTTVCVLSHEWLASTECIKELRIALELGRRVIPVLIDPVDPSDMPPELARLQFVFFHGEGHSYARGVVNLIEALRTDIGWVREQTRLLDKAHEWTVSNNSKALLLRGAALEGALEWVASRPPEHTHILPLLTDYVAQSEANQKNTEKKRMQGRFWFTFLIGLVLVGVMGAGLLFSQLNAQRAATAEQAAEADAQRVRAEKAELEKELMLADLGGFDEQAEEEIAYEEEDYALAPLEEVAEEPAPAAPGRGPASVPPVRGLPSPAPVEDRTPVPDNPTHALVLRLNDSDKAVRLQAGQEVAVGLRKADNDALLRELVGQLEMPRLAELTSSGRFNILYMLNAYDAWPKSPYAGGLSNGLALIEQRSNAGTAAIGSQTRDCLDRLGEKLAGKQNVGDRCGGR